MSTKVTAARHNNLQTRIEKVLGNGVGDFGYGQAVTSTQVSPGDVIRSQDINLVYNDMIKARQHQTGSLSTVIAELEDNRLIAEETSVVIDVDGDPSAGTENTAQGIADYERLMDSIEADRLLVATNQLSIDLAGGSTRSSKWYGSVYHEFTLTFDTYDKRRHYFNAGGSVVIKPSLTLDLNPNTKTQEWNSFIDAIGFIDFNYTRTNSSGEEGTGTLIGNTVLNGTYQTIFQATMDQTYTYSGNEFTVQARSPEYQSEQDPGNTIQFRINFVDTYDDFFNISGTLGNEVSYKRSTGAVLTQVPGYTNNVELSSFPVPSDATYELVAVDEINEGGTVTVTLNTTNLPENTEIPYTIESGAGFISLDDISLTSLTGVFTLKNTNENGTDSISFDVLEDSIPVEAETFRISLDNGRASKDITIVDKTPTYDLTFQGPAIVNGKILEGESFIAKLETTNVGDGTVPYTITGVTTGNVDVPLTGNFQVINDEAQIPIQLSDNIQNSELTLSLDNGLDSASVLLETYTLSVNTTPFDEGSQYLFTLDTTNVPDIPGGTPVAYSILGIQQSDISAPLEGDFIVNSNTATLLFTVVADELSEGTEQLTLSLNNGLASLTVDINDTSVTKSLALRFDPAGPVVEGSNVNLILDTTGYSDGTTIQYTLTGIQAQDIDQNLTGTIPINNNEGILPIAINSDTTVESEEVISAVATDGAGVTSNTATLSIRDTSATYQVTLDPSIVTEGDTIDARLTTTNVPIGTQVAYTISGVDPEDIGIGVTGSFEVGDFDSGNPAVSRKLIPVTIDGVSELPETITLKLNNGASSDSSTIQNAVPTYSVAFDPSLEAVVEGSNLVANITTTNLPSPFSVDYQITGVQASDINVPLTGNITIVNNSATFTIPIINDSNISEGETLTLSIAGGQASDSLPILDQTPTYKLTASSNSVTEGEDDIVITLTTTNVPDGPVPYTIRSTNPGDVSANDIGVPLTGNFTINNNTAELTIPVLADAESESESLTLQLDNGADSVTVSINDFNSSFSISPVSLNFTSIPGGELPDKQRIYFSSNVPTEVRNINVDGGYTEIDFTGATGAPTTLPPFIVDGNNDKYIDVSFSRSVYQTSTTTLTIATEVGDFEVLLNWEPLPKSYSASTRVNGITVNSVDEGQTVTFLITAQNVKDFYGVGYEITGVSPSDVNSSGLPSVLTFRTIDGSSEGTATASIDIPITADAVTEGTEVLSLRLNDTDLTKEFKININDTSTNPGYSITRSTGIVNEGETVTFTIITTNFGNGTIPYEITGVGSADIDKSLNGSVQINNNSGSITVLVKTDAIPESSDNDGEMTFTIFDPQNPLQALTSSTVTIFDTSPIYTLSAASTSILEGESITINLQTENVANGTSVPFTVTGNYDFGSSADGAFSVNVNPFSGIGTASVTLNTTVDNLVQANKTNTLSLVNGFASLQFTIIDNTPTFNLTSNPSSSVTEGNSVTFTLSNDKIASGTFDYDITGNTSEISTPSSGSISISNFRGSLDVNIPEDTNIGDSGSITLNVDTGFGKISKSVDIIDNSPTYTLSSATNIQEGTTGTVTLFTTNLSTTEVPYEISGVVDSSDFGIPLTGTITVGSNGQGTLDIPVSADAKTEGNENFRVAVFDTGGNTADFIDLTIVDTSTSTYTLSANKSSVDEGDSVTVILNASGLPDGTNVNYTATVQSNLGSTVIKDDKFTTTNNSDSETITVPTNSETESNYLLRVSLDNGQAEIEIPIVDTTPVFDVTGDNGPILYEGDQFRYIVTATNISPGTTYPYTISGVPQSQIDIPLSGTLTLQQGDGIDIPSNLVGGIVSGTYLSDNTIEDRYDSNNYWGTPQASALGTQVFYNGTNVMQQFDDDNAYTIKVDSLEKRFYRGNFQEYVNGKPRFRLIVENNSEDLGNNEYLTFNFNNGSKTTSQTLRDKKTFEEEIVTIVPPDVSNLQEGRTYDFTVYYTNLGSISKTYNWFITGTNINAGDISTSGSLSGKVSTTATSFSTPHPTSEIRISIRSDELTEGTEQLRLELQETDGTVVASVNKNIDDTSTTPLQISVTSGVGLYKQSYIETSITSAPNTTNEYTVSYQVLSGSLTEYETDTTTISLDGPSSTTRFEGPHIFSSVRVTVSGNGETVTRTVSLQQNTTYSPYTISEGWIQEYGPPNGFSGYSSSYVLNQALGQTSVSYSTNGLKIKNIKDFYFTDKQLYSVDTDLERLTSSSKVFAGGMSRVSSTALASEFFDYINLSRYNSGLRTTIESNFSTQEEQVIAREVANWFYISTARLQNRASVGLTYQGTPAYGLGRYPGKEGLEFWTTSTINNLNQTGFSTASQRINEINANGLPDSIRQSLINGSGNIPSKVYYNDNGVAKLAYGLARNPNVVGFTYWVEQQIKNFGGSYTRAMLQAMVNGVGNVFDDRTAVITPSKTFRENTNPNALGDFNDKP